MSTRTPRYPPVLCCIATLSLVGQGAGLAQSTSTVEDWRADLEFMVETFESVHPNPFHRITREDFQAARRDLERQLPELSTRETVVSFMRLLALAADGHTRFDLPENWTGKWYPIRFEQFREGTFVNATDRAHGEWLGARVVSLGGLPIDDVWKRAGEVSAGDNPGSRLAATEVLLSSPDTLAGLGIGDGNELDLELEIDSEGIRSVSISPIKWTSPPGWTILDRRVPGGGGVMLPNKIEDVDLPFRRDDDYWYERHGPLLYAQVNRIDNSRTPVWTGDKERALSLTAFFEALLDEVDRQPPEKLVIDLRWNRGGNNFFTRAFARGLSTRPNLNLREKLFVITGRRTYSAAMNLVSMIEGYTNATFVGEPAGGSPIHYGDARPFRLPYSGLRFYVSTVHWDLGVNPYDIREVMEPDVPVAPSIVATKTGRDDALDAVRDFEPGDVLSDRLYATLRGRSRDSVVEELRALEEPAGPVTGSHVQQMISFANRLGRNTVLGPDVFQTITDRYPDSHEAWFARGNFLARGDREASVQAYQRAHTLWPQHSWIRANLESAKRQR